MRWCDEWRDKRIMVNMANINYIMKWWIKPDYVFLLHHHHHPLFVLDIVRLSMIYQQPKDEIRRRRRRRRKKRGLESTKWLFGRVCVCVRISVFVVTHLAASIVIFWHAKFSSLAFFLWAFADRSPRVGSFNIIASTSLSLTFCSLLPCVFFFFLSLV